MEYSRNTSLAPDEGFDHESIMSRGTSPGLVRGVSTARSSRRAKGSISETTRVPSYIDEEDNDVYDEGYSKKHAMESSLVDNAAAPAGQSKGYYQDLGVFL
jgi:hypothetical protein